MTKVVQCRYSESIVSKIDILLEQIDLLLFALVSEVRRLKVAGQKVDWLAQEASLFIADCKQKCFCNVHEHNAVSKSLLLPILHFCAVEDFICAPDEALLLGAETFGAHRIATVFFLDICRRLAFAARTLRFI